MLISHLLLTHISNIYFRSDLIMKIILKIDDIHLFISKVENRFLSFASWFVALAAKLYYIFIKLEQLDWKWSYTSLLTKKTQTSQATVPNWDSGFGPHYYSSETPNP